MVDSKEGIIRGIARREQGDSCFPLIFRFSDPSYFLSCVSMALAQKGGVQYLTPLSHIINLLSDFAVVLTVWCGMFSFLQYRHEDTV